MIKTLNKILKTTGFIFMASVILGCTSTENRPVIQDVTGTIEATYDKIWLSHEHLMVDFIGADSINPESWNHDSIIREMMPYLEELKEFNVDYFVDATPAYLGRDVILLQKLAEKSGISIITNTGFYGAVNNKYIPDFVYNISAEELAAIWINEFQNGIDGASIKPGFIKISVEATDPLSEIHQKIVKAAALTHLETGLTIASHTGKAIGLWPQLQILKQQGVSPEAFIWVHAQAEEDKDTFLKAAEAGSWISLDGLAWDLDNHVDKILLAKENGFLNRVLISHDAGWYDPQKETQDVKPYTNIYKKLRPALLSKGLTEDEFNQLISVNPAKAFSIEIRKQH